MLEQEIAPAAEMQNDGNPPTEPPKPTGKQRKAMAHLRFRFTGCGHCSLFLTDYLLSERAETFLNIASSHNDDRISLPWNDRIFDNLNRIYSWSVENNTIDFESACPECRRTFSFSTAEDGQIAFLLIDI